MKLWHGIYRSHRSMHIKNFITLIMSLGSALCHLFLLRKVNNLACFYSSTVRFGFTGVDYSADTWVKVASVLQLMALRKAYTSTSLMHVFVTSIIG